MLRPGLQPDLALAALLEGSAGLVFPSVYEGIGLPVLGLLCLGLLLATSHASNLPELAMEVALLMGPKSEAGTPAALASLREPPDLADRLWEAGFSKPPRPRLREVRPVG